MSAGLMSRFASALSFKRSSNTASVDGTALVPTVTHAPAPVDCTRYRFDKCGQEFTELSVVDEHRTVCGNAPLCGMYKCCAQVAMTNEVDSTEIYKIMQPGQYVEVLKWVERSTRWRGHTSTGENPLLLPHTLCCVYCYVDLSCEGMWVSLVSQSGMQLLQFAKEVSTDEAVGGVAATEGLTKVAEAATEAPKVIPVNRVQYRCDKCSQVFDELAAAEKHEAACGTNPVDTNETMSDKLVDEEAANASSSCASVALPLP
jgi:hypothetical protein